MNIFHKQYKMYYCITTIPFTVPDFSSSLFITTLQNIPELIYKENYKSNSMGEMLKM